MGESDDEQADDYNGILWFENVPTSLSYDHTKILLAGFAVAITVGVITWNIHGGWKVPILTTFGVWLYLEILWTIHRPKYIEPPQ